MYKSILCIILAVLLILPLCACGKQEKLSVLVCIDNNEEQLEMLEGLKKSVEKSGVEIKEEILYDNNNFPQYQADILSKYTPENTDVVFSMGIAGAINFAYEGKIPFVSATDPYPEEPVKALFYAQSDVISAEEVSKAAGQYVQEHYKQGESVGIIESGGYSDYVHGALETLNNNLHHFKVAFPLEVYGTDEEIRDSVDAYVQENGISILICAKNYKNSIAYKCLASADHVIYYGPFAEEQINLMLADGYEAVIGNSYYEYGYAIGEQLVNYSKGITPENVTLPIMTVTQDDIK